MISGKITYLFHNAVDLESSSTTKADAVERRNINKSMGIARITITIYAILNGKG